MLGCLVIGFLFNFLKNKPNQRELWLLLGTGFCGGFTTMSAFASELVHLGDSNQLLIGASYLFITWIFGIIFTLVGINISDILLRRQKG
jgi:CrcB protein